MKPLSGWIIRIALTVQFLGVLAVPVCVAAGDLSAEAQPAKAMAIIERALQSIVANNR